MQRFYLHAGSGVPATLATDKGREMHMLAARRTRHHVASLRTQLLNILWFDELDIKDDFRTRRPRTG